MNDENRSWLSDTIRISMRNRSIRCKYNAYINKCIHANNGKQITWFRLNINCIGWWSESKICVDQTSKDQTTLTFFAPSAINWYPVSLLTATPRGDGTQSRNQSNEPPLGDSLLFKSDLMPLFSPTLPRDPKGGGFNWLVQYTLLKRSTNHPPYTLLSSAVAIWSIPRLNKASAQFIAFVPRRLCSRARFSLEGRKVIGCA